MIFYKQCNDKNVPQSLNGNVARPTWTAIEESGYKNLFVDADAFPFVNDAHLGTVAEPLIFYHRL